MYNKLYLGNNYIRGEKMTSRRLKKQVVYMIYSFIVITLLILTYFIQGIVNKSKVKEDGVEYDYVSDVIIDEYVPVVETKDVMVKPFNDSEVTISKSYYDYLADAENQQKSIIYYENTYMQNSGISYTSPNEFDIVSVLGGTVINVSKDELLGNIVEIKHANNVISVYQSLGDVTVKKDDVVSQGQVIGTSGISNLEKEIPNLLHFELIVSGNVVNPENYYNKEIKAN